MESWQTVIARGRRRRTQDDDLTLEMPPLEQLIRARQLLRHHQSPIPRSPKIPGSQILHQSRETEHGVIEPGIPNCIDASTSIDLFFATGQRTPVTRRSRTRFFV
jgi:hypothetical protein